MGKPEKITECPHQSVNTKQLCYRCIDINDTIDEYEAYLSQKQVPSDLPTVEINGILYENFPTLSFLSRQLSHPAHQGEKK